MNHLSLSDKGQRLVNMYTEMAKSGYATNIGTEITDAYNSFELRKIRDVIKKNLISMKLTLFLIMVAAVRIGMLLVLKMNYQP